MLYRLVVAWGIGIYLTCAGAYHIDAAHIDCAFNVVANNPYPNIALPNYFPAHIPLPNSVNQEFKAEQNNSPSTRRSLKASPCSPSLGGDSNGHLYSSITNYLAYIDLINNYYIYTKIFDFIYGEDGTHGTNGPLILRNIGQHFCDKLSWNNFLRLCMQRGTFIFIKSPTLPSPGCVKLHIRKIFKQHALFHLARNNLAGINNKSQQKQAISKSSILLCASGIKVEQSNNHKLSEEILMEIISLISPERRDKINLSENNISMGSTSSAPSISKSISSHTGRLERDLNLSPTSSWNGAREKISSISSFLQRGLERRIEPGPIGRNIKVFDCNLHFETLGGLGCDFLKVIDLMPNLRKITLHFVDFRRQFFLRDCKKTLSYDGIKKNKEHVAFFNLLLMGNDLSALKGLNYFHLDYGNSTSNCISSLASALQKSHITRFKFSMQGFIESIDRALMQAIVNIQNLQYLDLSNNSLSSNAVLQIADLASKSETLVKINLCGDEVGLRYIKKSLFHLSNIKTFRLLELSLSMGQYQAEEIAQDISKERVFTKVLIQELDRNHNFPTGKDQSLHRWQSELPEDWENIFSSGIIVLFKNDDQRYLWAIGVGVEGEGNRSIRSRANAARSESQYFLSQAF